MNGKNGKSGEERKIAGMELVAISGDEELVALKEAYRSAVDAWLARWGSEVFTCEDIRKDLGDPPGHDNSMGSTMGGLKRRGLIKKIGSKKADRAIRNSGEIDEYVKTEFYEAYLVKQFGEVGAARKLLEPHKISLLDAAKIVADICNLPDSARDKIVDLLEV